MTRETNTRQEQITEIQGIAVLVALRMEHLKRFTQIAETTQFTKDELAPIIDGIISRNKNYELLFILARTQQDFSAKIDNLEFNPLEIVAENANVWNDNAKLAITLLILGNHWSGRNEETGLPRFVTTQVSPNNSFATHREQNEDDTAAGVQAWDLYSSSERKTYDHRRQVEQFLLPASRSTWDLREFIEDLSDIAMASDSLPLLERIKNFRYTNRSVLSYRLLTDKEKEEIQGLNQRISQARLNIGSTQQAVTTVYDPTHSAPVTLSPVASTPGNYTSSRYPTNTQGPQATEAASNHDAKLQYFAQVNGKPLGYLKFFNRGGLPLLHYAISCSAWKCADQIIEWYIKSQHAYKGEDPFGFRDSEDRSALEFAKDMQRFNAANEQLNKVIASLEGIISVSEQKEPSVGNDEIKQKEQQDDIYSPRFMPMPSKTKLLEEARTKAGAGIWGTFDVFEKYCKHLEESGIEWSEIRSAIVKGCNDKEKGHRLQTPQTPRTPRIRDRIGDIRGFIEKYEPRVNGYSDLQREGKKDVLCP